MNEMRNEGSGIQRLRSISYIHTGWGQLKVLVSNGMDHRHAWHEGPMPRR
jgi:hypothetical protein